MPRGRLIVFALGDFAFNIYWQSVTAFLLFYYTDALGLPMTVAALGYTLASGWDGVASLLAGIVADRWRPARGFGGVLLAGAFPLGLSFALLYLPVPGQATWAPALVIGCHLLFRTAYAFTNIPYVAMSTRISPDSRDRQIVSGLRMAFGTAAAVAVSLLTIPLGAAITRSAAATSTYLASALVFAVVGTALLALVGGTLREPVGRAPARPLALRRAVSSLARNRAYLTLNLAMMMMIVGVTILNKSVLYYFKYIVGDASSGQLALASMAAASAVAVPLWMAVSRRIGLRATWFAAAALGSAGLLLLGVAGPTRPLASQAFLVAMQAIAIGLHFVFWAMLPNTIDYGEATTGVRVEGLAFGVAALLQRLAIGAATALMGVGFGVAGYVPNAHQSAPTLAGMRATIALVPFACLLLSAVFMALSPLRRGAHARIVRSLAAARRQEGSALAQT